MGEKEAEGFGHYEEKRQWGTAWCKACAITWGHGDIWIHAVYGPSVLMVTAHVSTKGMFISLVCTTVPVESWQVAQLSYYSEPDLGLWAGLPNIYAISDLEHVMGAVLQNQSWRTSMTYSNSKISERSPGKIQYWYKVLFCRSPRR